MPNNTTETQKTIIIHPYIVCDPQEDVQEWWDDQDETEGTEVTDIEIVSYTFEKWVPTITKTPENEMFLLEEISQDRFSTDAWVVQDGGSLQHCLDFVQNCPGTGHNARIRKADRDWVRVRAGKMELTPNGDSDEYWVETQGECGAEAWDMIHAGTYDECYGKMLMAQVGKPNTQLRIRALETHTIEYEHQSNGSIHAIVTYQS